MPVKQRGQTGRYDGVRRLAGQIRSYFLFPQRLQNDFVT